MGRYDKIKVYHNGQWKQPTACRVYQNGTWVDIGANDSDNTKSIYVRKNNNYVRATLNKKTTTVVTERYANSPFNLLPASGFCWNPPDGAWYFRGTVRKTTSASKRVFYCGDSSANYSVQLWWEDDGRLTFICRYNGNENRFSSSNSVGANQWVYINVFSNAGSKRVYMDFNGVRTESGSMYQAFEISNAWNAVGDANIQFKDNLSAAGVKWNEERYSVSFNASTASGSDGWQYTNVPHYEATTQVVTWE